MKTAIAITPTNPTAWNSGWNFQKIGPSRGKHLECRDCSESQIEAVDRAQVPPVAQLVAWVITWPDGRWQFACQRHVFTPQVPR